MAEIYRRKIEVLRPTGPRSPDYTVTTYGANFRGLPIRLNFYQHHYDSAVQKDWRSALLPSAPGTLERMQVETARRMVEGSASELTAEEQALATAIFESRKTWAAGIKSGNHFIRLSEDQRLKMATAASLKTWDNVESKEACKEDLNQTLALSQRQYDEKSDLEASLQKSLREKEEAEVEKAIAASYGATAAASSAHDLQATLAQSRRAQEEAE